MLDEFFVAEQLRGRGIGTRALGFAAQWCRERQFEVDPENRLGQKLICITLDPGLSVTPGAALNRRPAATEDPNGARTPRILQ